MLDSKLRANMQPQPLVGLTEDIYLNQEPPYSQTHQSNVTQSLPLVFSGSCRTRGHHHF